MFGGGGEKIPRVRYFRQRRFTELRAVATNPRFNRSLQFLTAIKAEFPFLNRD
jgi:hypothetical protein